ncbi:MAG TPA: hypothetical protein VLS87_09015 [Woeseiaceae bacterium]|nr:hypothetical protein [Woeseiaceae bacterium]
MTNAAAATAALLGGVLIAVTLAAGSPDNGQSQRTLGEAGTGDLQAGFTVRGQAWATELFGRRYGRHLMAAVAAESGAAAGPTGPVRT